MSQVVYAKDVAVAVGVDAPPQTVELQSTPYKSSPTPVWTTHRKEGWEDKPANGREEDSIMNFTREGSATRCCCYWRADSLKFTMSGPFGSQCFTAQGDPLGNIEYGCCAQKPVEEMTFNMVSFEAASAAHLERAAAQAGKHVEKLKADLEAAEAELGDAAKLHGDANAAKLAGERAFATGESTMKVVYSTKAQELHYAIWGTEENPASVCHWACCGWCCDCSNTGYCPVACCGPDMTVKTQVDGKMEPVGAIFTAMCLKKKCFADSILEATMTNGKHGDEEVMLASIRTPVKSCTAQACVGPLPCCSPDLMCCGTTPDSSCFCAPIACIAPQIETPGIPKIPGSCDCCSFDCCTPCCPTTPGKDGTPECFLESACCCCADCISCDELSDQCMVAICSNRVCQMFACGNACVQNPWCCDPFGTWRMELGAGNMDHWVTPEGENYSEILQIDHVVEGHNCCPFMTVQETKVKLKHWEPTSSEALAMSVLPFWEIYSTGPKDAMRIKEGRLKTTGAFSTPTTAEERQAWKSKGFARNRRLFKQDPPEKPDMVKTWPN